MYSWLILCHMDCGSVCLFREGLMKVLDSSLLLEQAVHISHLHKHSLQLGVVLNGHLAILSSDPWKTQLYFQRVWRSRIPAEVMCIDST